MGLTALIYDISLRMQGADGALFWETISIYPPLGIIGARRELLDPLGPSLTHNREKGLAIIGVFYTPITDRLKCDKIRNS